jgi:hypothetical protein
MRRYVSGDSVMIYVRDGAVPRSIPKRQVLCHNDIQHWPNMPCGVNGFRAWTEAEPPKDFVKCPCGYAGLPHYAARDHVAEVREEGMKEWHCGGLAYDPEGYGAYSRAE